MRFCFGCLKKASHLAKDCNRKLRCDTCKRRHPTILHNDRYQPGASGTNEQRTTTNVNKQTTEDLTQCGLIGAGSTSPAQTVVPVIIRSKETGVCVKTNALLDEGSDAVFCTERLMKKLGTDGPKTNLRVQTLTGERTVKSHKLVDLEVMDIDGVNTIELPKVYTCTTIPTNKMHIPTREDLKQWPYLQRIQLPEFQGEVDVLIGNNIPKALEP
jgi:hypothetical protein